MYNFLEEWKKVCRQFHCQHCGAPIRAKFHRTMGHGAVDTRFTCWVEDGDYDKRHVCGNSTAENYYSLMLIAGDSDEMNNIQLS